MCREQAGDKLKQEDAEKDGLRTMIKPDPNSKHVLDVCCVPKKSLPWESLQSTEFGEVFVYTLGG